MYKYGATANNAYVLENVNRCSTANNLSTSTCPVGSGWSGFRIYQIRDLRKYNACVGLSGINDYAYEVGCNNTAYPGAGGGTGTLFMKIPGSCPSGYFTLANVHYLSNNTLSGYGYHLEGKGFNGALVRLDGGAWCWAVKSF